MNINWKKLLLCLLVPLATGGLAAWLSRGSMQSFALLNKPPLAPPGWLFPLVWTVLYLLMGIASYLLLCCGANRAEIRRALRLYGLQLVLNFFWPLLFFNLAAYLFAFLWLLALWLVVLLTLLSFGRISRPAAVLLLPYLLWLGFAAYLNLGIYLLN